MVEKGNAQGIVLETDFLAYYKIAYTQTIIHPKKSYS